MAEQTTSNCTPRGFTTQESQTPQTKISASTETKGTNSIRRCRLKTGKDTGAGAIGRAIIGVRTNAQPVLYPYRSLGGKLSMTPSWEDKVVLKSVLPVKET